MKNYNLFNTYHLGDNIFNIHYLNKYLNYDYIFNYYVNSSYIKELNFHIKNININLLPLDNGVPFNSINTWIGHNRFYHNWILNENKFDLFYVDFFKSLSKTLGIESKINSNTDMLFDNSNFKISTDRNYDFLIINSIPMSGQFNYNEQDFIELCDYLNYKNISFITTKKIRNYDCTLDLNMSIVDIGNLSDSCSNIIAINTAPIISTFTTKNIDKINNRFILDNVVTYSYNNRIHQIKQLKNLYEFI